MNEKDLERYMDQYTSYLLRIGFYYTKDIEKSKDIVQEAFIKFYYSNYQEQGNVKAYLATLVANRCKDYLKSWSYRKITVQQMFQKEPSTYEKNYLVEQDERQIIDAAILNLPIKLREVTVFYYVEQVTIKEIANVLKIPESTVKTRLKTAKQKLKEILCEVEWEVLLHG